MKQLTINTSNQSYPVYIGNNILEEAPDLLGSFLDDKSKALIISDTNVSELYGDKLKRILEPILPVSIITVPNGEHSKSMASYEKLLTACIEQGLDRQSVIFALGGGVIGDLAGFSAATYMRGIPFVQVPTTLLAHDSSVGGKTGINHPLGKNLIGAFHQPSAVLYDTGTLTTLPDEEWRSGFAEMIKHAYIQDPDFLHWLKENVKTIADIKTDKIRQFLKRSIAVKAEIVKEDEREAGIRAFLNFGHTLGHALEKTSGYDGQITHGEAVAAGMVFAMRLSNELGISAWNVSEEINWLKSLNYPVEAPSQYSAQKLINAMKKDKKASAGNIKFVLLKEPGRPLLYTIDEKLLIELLTNDQRGMTRND
ncbi:3-dehydroquinate synthase [Alteribacillus bidgolensis]|uniref:3-dehydroquinate synthase n=1 Tax=Alteribacillus bidgolensis TaxID=930129 RepID=A0A1G8C7B2_9BACI|nr:3-dehydroquinate synthase [Alteribacillus bidgolensis]SDH40760.1 3-dehydroquinate synthase [Alteribacillus bidgolensis]